MGSRRASTDLERSRPMSNARKALIASMLACALLASGDSQFLQWTSYAVSGSLLATAWLGVFLTLLLPTALPTMTVALWRPRHQQSEGALFAAAFTAAWITYQLARAKMTRTLGLTDTTFAIGMGLALVLAFVVGSRVPSRARRSGAVAGAVLATAAAMIGWVFASQSLGTTPNVILALARTDSPLGYPIRSSLLFVAWASLMLLPAMRLRSDRALLAGIVAASWLVQAGSFPIAPGVISPAVEVQSSGPPQLGAAPDVFLIVMDTVRADRLSAYGHPHLTTPGLDDFATGATLYRHAYANATWSLPSHASMLTGLLPFEHDADFAITARPGTTSGEVEVVPTPLRSTVPLLPELLREVGYHTALIAANHAFFAPDFGLSRGFEYRESRPASVTPFESLLGPVVRRTGLVGLEQRYDSLASSTRGARDILAAATSWLDDPRRPRTPLLMVINLMDAHDPRVNGPRAARSMDWLPDRAPGESTLERDYERSLALLDHHLTEFFDGLRRRNLLDPSLVIVTSDHGETFYEDGTSAHARHVFQDQVHVPLIIKEPLQIDGQVIDHAVQLVDLFPTILEHVEGAGPEGLAGARLPRGTAPVLRNLLSNMPTGDPLTLDNVDLERPSSWAVIVDSHKFVLLSGGGHRLFDLDRDPDEEHDLVTEMPDLAEALEARLRAVFPVGFETAHRTLRAPDTLDPTTLQRLKSLGYIR